MQMEHILVSVVHWRTQGVLLIVFRYGLLVLSSSQASFVASGNRTDISLDDPNFWQKWAKIAELDTEAKSEKVQH